MVADFIARTIVLIELEYKTYMEDIPKWTLYVEGSASKKRNGAGIVLVMLDKVLLSFAI